MTVINGVGISAETKVKQEYLKSFLSCHLSISRAILLKYSRPFYYYFDLTAGPGLGKDGYVGSPVIFDDLSKRLGLNTRIYLFEKNKTSYDSLKKLGFKNVLCERWQEHIKEVIPGFSVLGLMYLDPNGMPDFDMLGTLFNNKSKIDVLVNVSATTIKRVRKVFGQESLIEKMEKINKKHWYIRTPVGKFEWTFIFGTNWDKFPAYKKIGFYRVDSKEGKDILETLNYTKQERVFRKGYLFEGMK